MQKKSYLKNLLFGLFLGLTYSVSFQVYGQLFSFSFEELIKAEVNGAELSLRKEILEEFQKKQYVGTRLELITDILKTPGAISAESKNEALDIAADHNRVDLAKILIQYGADVNAKLSVPILFRAARKGYLEVVRCLLENEADPYAYYIPRSIWDKTQPESIVTIDQFIIESPLGLLEGLDSERNKHMPIIIDLIANRMLDIALAPSCLKVDFKGILSSLGGNSSSLYDWILRDLKNFRPMYFSFSHLNPLGLEHVEEKNEIKQEHEKEPSFEFRFKWDFSLENRYRESFTIRTFQAIFGAYTTLTKQEKKEEKGNVKRAKEIIMRKHQEGLQEDGYELDLPELNTEEMMRVLDYSYCLSAQNTLNRYQIPFEMILEIQTILQQEYEIHEESRTLKSIWEDEKIVGINKVLSAKDLLFKDFSLVEIEKVDLTQEPFYSKAHDMLVDRLDEDRKKMKETIILVFDKIRTLKKALKESCASDPVK